MTGGKLRGCWEADCQEGGGQGAPVLGLSSPGRKWGAAECLWAGVTWLGLLSRKLTLALGEASLGGGDPGAGHQWKGWGRWPWEGAGGMERKGQCWGPINRNLKIPGAVQTWTPVIDPGGSMSLVWVGPGQWWLGELPRWGQRVAKVRPLLKPPSFTAGRSEDLGMRGWDSGPWV